MTVLKYRRDESLEPEPSQEAGHKEERLVFLARLLVLAFASQLQHIVSLFQRLFIIIPQREKLTSVFKILKLQ